jgi:hypothetical protein
MRIQQSSLEWVVFLLTLSSIAGAQPTSADPAPSSAGACPGDGDCCQPNGTPGCDDFACCDLVCALVPSCCDIGWDQECADLAIGACSPDACAGQACPGDGECCVQNGSPGCHDINCCNLVCGSDPYCCDTEWDSTCANMARELCSDICEPPVRCPGDGDCCRDTDSPGCADVECCELVCDEDEFCCTGEWDELCARKANAMCGDGTGGFCSWCPDEGDCCAGHGSPGCDKAACCEAVCAMQDACCTRFWTGTCADLAATLCADTACDCSTFGDLYPDERFDLRDASGLFNCFTGPGGPPIASDCACADHDGDGYVDLNDYRGLYFLLAP